MLWAFRILSGLWIITFGYILTVGQAGLGPVNRNICDLLNAVSPWPQQSCAFQNVIVGLWALGALAAATFLLIELFRWLRKKPTPQAIVNGLEKAIQINYGEDGPFERLIKADTSRLERMLLIEFQNNHQHVALTGCKVEITSIEPFMGVRRPLVLRNNFTLAAGDHVFIPLATYGEGRTVDRSAIADSAIAVCAPEGESPHFLAALPHDVENILTIRGTAIGSAYCEDKVVIWVGAGTRLRIRKYELGDEAEFISLETATSEAYGEARNTEIGRSAEKLNTNGVLSWFAWYYHTKEIPIYGNVRPSAVREPVLFRNVDIKLDNDKLIAKEIYGDLIWVNMCVKKTDHARLLRLLREHAKGLNS